MATGVDPQVVQTMRHMGEARWAGWVLDARPEQVPHPVKPISVFVAGRGSGKTRAGAEWLCKMATTEVGAYGLIGPDYAHLITECLEAYIYNMIPAELRRWRGQILNQLDLANGSVIKLYTAKVPGKVRGPNLKGYWMDEPAEMQYGMDAWDNAQFATRVPLSNGNEPQCYVTGTPKRVKLVQMLLGNLHDEADVIPPEDIHISLGSTRDNEANLSERTVRRLYAAYEGTSLGLQELEGILLDDVDGALMQGKTIAKHRAERPHPSPSLRVLSVDPGFSDKQTSDECGIVIGHRIGNGTSAIGEVLDDCSRHGTPGAWAPLIADKCDEWDIDVIVYEGNMTGQWVKETLSAELARCARTPRLESVTSRSSKWARAEPVAALAERGRYRMVGEFGSLESELTSWVPDTGMRSPNRLDAWAQLGRYMLIKTASSGGVGKKRTKRVGSMA